MGYVERHLLPKERVIYKTRLHWILFAKPVMATLLAFALCVAAGAATRIEWIWYLSLVVLVAWWLLRPFGNTGLWMAILIYFGARGALQAVRYPALARGTFKPATARP